MYLFIAIDWAEREFYSEKKQCAKSHFKKQGY